MYFCGGIWGGSRWVRLYVEVDGFLVVAYGVLVCRVEFIVEVDGFCGCIWGGGLWGRL